MEFIDPAELTAISSFLIVGIVPFSVFSEDVPHVGSSLVFVFLRFLSVSVCSLNAAESSPHALPHSHFPN